MERRVARPNGSATQAARWPSIKIRSVSDGSAWGWGPTRTNKWTHLKSFAAGLWRSTVRTSTRWWRSITTTASMSRGTRPGTGASSNGVGYERMIATLGGAFEGDLRRKVRSIGRIETGAIHAEWTSRERRRDTGELLDGSGLRRVHDRARAYPPTAQCAGPRRAPRSKTLLLLPSGSARHDTIRPVPSSALAP